MAVWEAGEAVVATMSLNSLSKEATMKKFMAWTLHESFAFGIAIIAFAYAGAKVWIRHQPTTSIVPTSVGVTAVLWFVAQLTKKRALTYAMWTLVFLSAVTTGILTLHYLFP